MSFYCKVACNSCRFAPFLVTDVISKKLFCRSRHQKSRLLLNAHLIYFCNHPARSVVLIDVMSITKFPPVIDLALNSRVPSRRVIVPSCCPVTLYPTQLNNYFLYHIFLFSVVVNAVSVIANKSAADFRYRIFHIIKV